MDKRDKGARETKKPTVQVQFHILMSEQIDLNPNTQSVFVAFQEERLGGLESRTRKLECCYRETGDIYELTYTEKIPAEYITNERYLVYKYLLKSENEDAVVWENYAKNGQSGAETFRYIKIPESCKTYETWHQYDGYFECKPDKLTTVFWNLWNKTGIVHATKCVEMFFPKLGNKEEKGISEFMHLLDMMLSGIKRVYLTDGQLWKSKKHFDKFVSKQCMEVLKTRRIKEKDKEYTTMMILCTVLVLYENGKIHFSDPDLVSLCYHLMPTANKGNNACLELEAVTLNLNEHRSKILKLMKQFVEHIIENTKDPDWLYLMPWIHFLSGECKPFEEPPFRINHDDKIPTWWGVSSISKYIEEIKSRSWNITPLVMANRLVPLFKMDYLMPRTFLAVIPLKDIQDLVAMQTIEVYPVEVCLATLIFFLKKGEKKTEKSVRECMDCLMQKLDKMFSTSTCLKVEAKLSYKFCSQMIAKCVLDDYVDDETLCRFVQMFLRCIDSFDKINHGDDKSSLTDEIETALDRVTVWMSKKDYQNSLDKDSEKYLKVWNELYAQENVNLGKVLDIWNTKLSNVLSQKFGNSVNFTKARKSWFVKYYCKNIDSFNSCMQEILNRIALEAVKEGHEQDHSNFTLKENKKFGALLSKLFLTEWEKYENESKNKEHMMVEFLLNWSAFSEILTIYCNEEKRFQMLSQECIKKVSLAASMVESFLETLLNGSISVDSLNLIKAKQERFSDLIKLLPKQPEETLITMAISVRESEIRAFQKLVKDVATLSTLCQCLRGVDKKEISSVMQRQAGIHKCRVSDLCKVETINEDFKLELFQPKTIGFETCSKFVETLPEIQACYESITFCNMWNLKCREEGDGCKTLDDVLCNIWTPVKGWFKTLARNIEAGETTFQHFEQLFGDKFKDDFAAMKKEVAHLNVIPSTIALRIDQLSKYRRLETCVFGAKSILKFAEQYQMTGNFQQILAIASYEENDMQMKSFDESLIKLCENLRDLTKEQVECLQTFVDCSELICWLKDSMKNAGLKELKVFVDLALMSAGEEPMNIARVQCLHTAVTGYAPLIFDLKKDAGFEELLELCRKVWKELEANPSLPSKLKDTTRHLQWLDNIQRAHGSVEVTSMKQADACNEHGEYTIGSNAWPNKRVIENATISMLLVKNILKLTVPGDEEKRETRNYNIEQLQDLQSRLMLVAGNSDKGTESVEKFTMIFDGALRLSNVYVKLCSAGCVLFKNWTAFFLCDPDRPVCVIIEFGETESQLKGRQSTTEELRDIIPKLAGFMESCYDNWLDFIKEKRKKFPHLNYFTTDQLVILQRELVKIGTNNEPSHLIFPLLSAVKSDCTKADLHKALSEAKAELDRVIEEAQQNEQVVEEPLEDMKIEVEFINTLVEHGFSESLARKAFKHVGPDPSEGFLWCLENTKSDTDEEIDEPSENDALSSKETSTFPTHTRWNYSNESFLDIITSRIKSMEKQR